MARGRKRGLIDLHVPSSPPTDTCIPQNNHSTSNTISFFAVSDLLRLFPAVSGHILTFSRAWTSPMQGDTAEYGPARAQKNQTGKWYPQIPVDHISPQINQRVVNTTLIPVKVKHCGPAVHCSLAGARLKRRPLANSQTPRRKSRRSGESPARSTADSRSRMAEWRMEAMDVAEVPALGTNKLGGAGVTGT